MFDSHTHNQRCHHNSHWLVYLSFGVDEEGAVTWNYGTLMSTIWSELGPLCQCYMRVKVVDVSILAYNTVSKRYFCMIVYCLSEYLRSYVIIGWRNFMLLSNTLLPSHKTCVYKKRIWNIYKMEYILRTNYVQL